MVRKAASKCFKIKTMRIIIRGLSCFLLIYGLVWCSGCRRRVQVSPPEMQRPSGTEITRTGYTVQVGAFSLQDNALRFTRSLNGTGLNAYCFLASSGLSKVRFGEFSSKEAASRAARDLLDRGLIGEHFIVGSE